jgi:large subunit ribosomal protein L19
LLQSFLKKGLPDLRPGDIVRVHQKIPASAIVSADKKKEEEKEKTQTFEGRVIAKKHGEEIGSTITVRKVISGVGVEKIFPLHSPSIEKIEVVKAGKVRRAKLYYLRKVKGKKSRLRTKEKAETLAKEQ